MKDMEGSGYTIYDLGNDIKKFFGGRSRSRGGNYRDTPMGNTPRQTRPQTQAEASMMYFDDEDNDPQELGGMAQRNELLATENREVHLDPTWKGLPKSLSADRKLKKMRKGFINPSDKYY